jgi:acid phosphatase
MIGAPNTSHYTFKILQDTPKVPPHMITLPESMPKYAKGECFYGQLTDFGRDHMKTLGSHLRDIYIKYLDFLPADWNQNTASLFYFRSSNYQRTIESLQSVFYGLYPLAAEASPEDHKVPKVVVHTRQEEAENMYPWAKCARLRVLQQQFKEAAQKTISRDIAYLNEKFQRLLATPDAFGAYPSFHGIYDSLYSAKFHNYDIQKLYNIDDADFLKLEQVVSKEWFYGFQKSEEMARLGIGRFIRDLLFAIREKMNGLNPDLASNLPPDPATGLHLFPSKIYEGIENFKFMIFSGHDSTIAPFLASIGVFDGMWPQFGANVALELIEEINNTPIDTERVASKLPRFFIRLKSNDQVYQLPSCAAFSHPSDPSLCPVDQFFKVCIPLIPVDLQEECSTAPFLSP